MAGAVVDQVDGQAMKLVGVALDGGVLSDDLDRVTRGNRANLCGGSLGDLAKIACAARGLAACVGPREDQEIGYEAAHTV